MLKSFTKRKTLILWIILLLFTLFFEAFYIRQNPMGDMTDMPDSDSGSISLTSGSVISQSFEYHEPNLDGFLIITSKDPKINSGTVLIELSSDGHSLQQWNISKYSYSGNKLKLILDKPIYNAQNKQFTLSFTCVGEDSGISLYLSSQTQSELIVNNTNVQKQSVCFSMIKKDVSSKTVFIFTAIFTVIAFIFIYYLINIKALRKAEYMFAFCYITMGIFQLFSVPIFSTPDEPNHFYRAYQISTGDFISQPNPDGISEGIDGAGGYLPEALTFGDDFSLPLTQLYDLEGMSEYKIEPESETFIEFGNTALYAPATYLPQVIGIKLSGVFTDHVLFQAYAARIFNWLVTGFLIYFSIKFLPIGKNLAFLISMLPMNLQSFNSMSPDAFTFAVAMGLVAFVLYIKYKTNSILNLRQYILMYLIVFILCQCKIVYAPLCLILFLIPKKRFGSTKKYFFNIIGIAAIGLITCLTWLSVSSAFLTEFNPGVNSSMQTSYILNSPLAFIETILKTFDASGDTYIRMAMGEQLGWLNITTSFTLLLIFGIIILIFFFLDNDIATVNFTRMTRVTLFCVSAVIILATFASLYIQWTSYHAETISGIQGRYFLPLLLPMLLALKPPVKMLNGSGLQLYKFVPIVLSINLVISSIVLTHAL